MDDKKLADAVVAEGVGEFHANSYWTAIGYTQVCYDAAGFVRDWRVAGALMEKCEADGWDALIDLQANCQPRVRLGRWQGEKCSTENTRGMGTSESLPRAIIEACVKALRENEDYDEEPHPDHCLCDDCVTLENIDERCAKSAALREDEK